MTTLIHYPGVFHHELDITEPVRFSDLWNQLRLSSPPMPATDDTDFFRRFLLFRNGIRQYTTSFSVILPDTVIVVAPNNRNVASQLLALSEIELPERFFTLCACPQCGHIGESALERMEKPLLPDIMFRLLYRRGPTCRTICKNCRHRFHEI